jgi:hypothetical protein
LFDKFHLPKVNTFKPKLFGLKTSFGGSKIWIMTKLATMCKIRKSKTGVF